MRRAAAPSPARFGSTLWLAASALAASLAAGCDDQPVHVFGAERYDPVGDCLEHAAALDVLEGAEPAPCDALRCWVTTAGDIYVTTSACDAPPDFADKTGDPPGSLCAKALDAFARKDHCEP